MVGTDGRPRPVGRRVPGLGRARRLPRHRPRRSTAGRVLRVPAEVLREPVDAWFPFGGHLIEGLYRTARSDRVDRAAAGRRWSRSARSPPGSPTRSTTRPRPRPARSTPSTTACVDAARRRCGGSPTARSRPPSSRALDDLRLELGAARSGARIRSTWPTARTRSPTGWTTTASSDDWMHRAAAGGRRRRRRLVRAGGRRAGGRRPRARAWSGWRARCSAATLLGEVKESTRRISELVAAVRSYSQMDRALDAARSTSPRASRARW